MSKHELISTEEFIDEIGQFDSIPTGIATYKVALDTSGFIQLTDSDISPYRIVPSSDGLVAVVQETPITNMQAPIDFSHQSRPFDLHKDGLYKPQVPHIAILHCEDPGTSGIPTFFADTQTIVNQLTSDDREKLSKLELVYVKKNGIQYTRPVMEPHSATEEPVINLGSTRSYVRPKDGDMPSISLRESTSIMQVVFDIADSVSRQHLWKQHDVVVFDNERFVHGRGTPQKRLESQAGDQARKLNRIWLERK